MSGGTGSGSYVGGLVGQLTGAAPSITASYARGAVTSDASANAGGLAGGVSAGATTPSSFWDVTGSGIADADPSTSPGEGKKTYELRTPTATTSTIYLNWDLDVDGDSNADDPWDFGASDQYPVLKYGGLDTAAQFARQPTLSSVNTLSGLTVPELAVSGVTLAPVFDAGTYAYAATSTDDFTLGVVTVNTPTTHAGATVSISAVIGAGAAVTDDANPDTDGYQVTLGAPSTVITITVAAQDGLPQDYTVTITVPEYDYDDDDDGLIDVTTLAQLDAIRWDLDGNGAADDAANNGRHAIGYPLPAAGMGCQSVDPDGAGPLPAVPTCAGYELRADLDFNTGQATRTDDAYYNDGAGWTPIGTDSTSYSSTFQGNGHSIANLVINAGSDVANVGLFRALSSGGVISGVGLPDVSVAGAADALSIGALAGDNVGTVTASWATGSVTASSAGSGVKRVGGLVGISGGRVRGSYAGVSVTASNAATAVSAGGLAGQLYNNAITASYATGAVAGGAGAGARTGGLVGWANGPSPSITASYSTGAVTSGTGANTGGVAGSAASGVLVNSYWDAETSGIAGGQTTGGLKTPTGYTGIYSAWNVNVDGVGGNDDPWDFGTNAQYPILQYDRDAVAIDRQRGSTGKDYDDDEGNLIDVTTLAQLDAMRYDLDGDGVSVTGAGAAKYATAFPGLSAGMGCPDTCAGYELRANLDFDTGTAGDRTDDEFYNGGAGWTPIGPDYLSTFQGNGHTIANLNVATPSQAAAGLFGTIISGGVSGLGLPNASVASAHSQARIGAIVGVMFDSGSITSSWATGSVTASSATADQKYAGGLVGLSGGQIRASYAGVSVTAADAATRILAGGLAGQLSNGGVTASYANGAVSGGTSATTYVGGLVGHLAGAAPTITASYATGAATSGASANVGGLAGNLPSGAVITYGYWDTGTSGIADNDPSTSAGEGKTTTELRTPTAYGVSTTTSIYAAWNVDVDGDAGTGDADGNDDPWDFGANDEYPVLQYGGLDRTAQLNIQPSLGALSGLTLSGARLSPAFATATLIYDGTLPVGSSPVVVTVDATPAGGATASISAVAGSAGPVTADADADTAGHQVILRGATTTITVIVTPLNGTPQDYVITIANIPENDYDDDDNNLIDVTTLAQLNAIRYDLNGDGVADSATNNAAYAAAFLYPAAGLGCDTTCAGYELRNGLEFNTGGAIRSDDAYYNDGAGWTPIGTGGAPYTGAFQGNGHTLSTLHVNAGADVATVGLFGTASGAITGIGLPDASVAGASDNIAIGALVGSLGQSGTVTSGWATGSVTSSSTGSSEKSVGGLVGYNGGAVRASYADVTVAADTTAATMVRAGGLIGRLYQAAITASYATGAVSGGTGAGSYAGGLAGQLAGVTASTITASYSTGTVTGGASAGIGGLAGSVASPSSVVNSYWDTTASEIADSDPSTSPGEGKKTYELRTPTASTSAIYLNWNVDVDGVTGGDDPWEYGTNRQYPVLKYGGLDTDAQFGRQPVISSVNTLSGLTASAITLAPAPFDAGTYTYAATLPDDSTLGVTTVAAPTTHADGTVSISAAIGAGAAVTVDADPDTAGYQVTLGGPSTVITVTVAAEDGLPQDYTVTITVPQYDYDANDNDRIDITSLAQLNAVRYDLNGDGVADDVANGGRYATGYPLPAAGLGCNTTCAGYELMADLDFNTGRATRTDDTYYNGGAGWTPIGGTYTSTFQGNGHTLSNLHVNADTTVVTVGLFGTITGAITGVGLPDASVAGASDNIAIGALAGALGQSGTVTSGWATGSVTSSSTGSSEKSVGGLVGYNGGALRASYADVMVTADTTAATTVRAGGLVGRLYQATITASYATGSVTGGSGATSYAGGLAGQLAGVTASTITASYSTGTVTGGASASVGGLAGGVASPSTVVNSYWDSDTSGISGGQTTSALQTPTGYTGIYSGWNVNVDGVGGNDDPWHFGANNQYPILQYDRGVIAVDRQRGSTGKDYDGNNNNLIDITTLAQLDAMRYDLDGDGAVAKGNASGEYAAAFPGLAVGMGCPDGCAGYELRANLDFDTGTAGDRTDDEFYNGGAGWTPIGTDGAPFSGTLVGNGHTLSNLHVNAGTDVVTVGLFGTLSGAVTGIGLPNASVTGARDSTAIGALVGTLQASGTVTSGWATGSVTSSNAGSAAKNVGGLVGFAYGTVRASYSGAAAVADAAATSVRAGGLVGVLNGGAVTASYATGAVSGGTGGSAFRGGLVGQLSGTAPSITASYAIGTVAAGAGANTGGLAGNNPAGAVITYSYWDTGTSGIASAGAGEGKTANELRTPTAYGTSTTTSIYAAWNVDVDGDPSNDDDPWDFGASDEYPVLQYGGLDRTAQVNLQPTVGTLTSLTLTGAMLTPGFDAATLAYTGTLPADASPVVVTVEAAAAGGATASYSAVAGSAGPVTADADADTAGHQVILRGATTTITVIVTPLNGTAQSYVITIAGIPENDYDDDDDNLIDVTTLAQLNAVRYDLNGDGVADNATDNAAYAAAYLYPAAGLGCAGTCAGYELLADLDFNTGRATRTDDDYYNGGAGWTPIGGTYASTFQGNGHTIANLVINAGSDAANVGLFRALSSGGVISGVGLPEASLSGAADALSIGTLAGDNVGTVTTSWASGSVTASSAGSGVKRVGGLVGISGGTVRGSYAGVSVTASNAATAVSAGGLAGQLYNNAITASYATGAVAGGAGAGSHTGGLVGWTNGPSPSITASYSTGAVTSGTGANTGGVAGSAASGVLVNSYWDAQTSGISGGQTTRGLQTPTGYTGIYAGWNVDVDGVGGNDDPWHFGANNQYPILQYDRGVVAIDRQRGSVGKDYDDDNNNLIDVRTLAQLDAMRYDGNGDGIVAKGSHSGHYAAAFPGLAVGMGCPDGCTGYELRNSLDFDTGTAGDRTDDAFYNGGAGWIPIRNYNSTLQGNGYTIANLHINADANVHRAGLFGPGTARISGLGLPNVSITGAYNWLRAGAIVGELYAQGSVTSSWATGSVTASSANGSGKSIGGLVGVSFAPIRASYADVTVTASTANTATTVNAGGLVGHLARAPVTASYATGAVSGGTSSASNVGGLVGRLEGALTITASYATGAVTAGTGANTGGLAGNNPTDAVITYSYWDTTTSGITGTGAGAGKTTGELRTPTAYGTSTTTDIYAAWNVDIDNADTDDDVTTGGDDPWEFGASDEYPVLKYGGLDTTAQVNLQPTVGTLTSLTLTGATLVPGFDAATLAYTGTLPPDASPVVVTVEAAAAGGATASYSAVAGSAGSVTADADANTDGHQVILRGATTTITVIVTPLNGAAQSYVITIAGIPENDYDTDDDNLIDVTTLAQLNAIRYDLDGNGVADNAAGAVAYAAAYLYPAAGLGCDTTCAGYELMADLDFSGSSAYANWTPIGGTYTSTFQGNGHTIAKLTVNAAAGVSRVGLFGALSSAGAISGIGLPDASVAGAADTISIGALVGDSGGTVTSSWATGSVASTSSSADAKYIGGLVGHVDGAVRAIYSGATVTASAAATAIHAGGLAGRVNSGTAIASYATGAVTGGTNATSYIGGLVGRAMAASTIAASYSTGTPGSTGASVNIGGAIGGSQSGATLSNNYWDADTSGISGGQRTSVLKMPTGYTGIYIGWNVDVDGVSGNDNPWQFGGNDEYPILQYDRDVIAVDRQRGSTGKDYDDDDDNLIDITTLAQLDAVRYDLDGDGAVAKGSASGEYAAAFPGLAVGMGCPDTCIGYELRANLDFDSGTAGDRTDDEFYNGGAGWTPIGTDTVPFSGTLVGNNHTLSNLYVNTGADVITIGLFGTLSGAVTGIGLPGASVSSARDSLAMGALVGTLRPSGTVTSVWATGSVTSGSADATTKYVGGLVGYGSGAVRASYAGVSVTAADAATRIRAGGLVGLLNGGAVTASYATGAVSGGTSNTSFVGGLVGQLTGAAPTITASYATGAPSSGASANVGGLAGNLPSGAVITYSYWDTGTSGIADNDPSTSAGEGKTTTELRTPTAYGLSTTTSIYAAWNVDVDNADTDDDVTTGGDDPWDFGANDEYPVLQYGGLDRTAQLNIQPSLGALSGLTLTGAALSPAFDTVTLTYDGTVPVGSSPVVVTVAATPAGGATASISAVAGSAAPVTTDADAGAAGHQVILGGPSTVITITVTPLNGTPQDYVITIANIPENDYDTDDDNLIDVTSLAQLNAIRYDLNGNGVADSATDNAAYAAAFLYAAAGMGCDTTCAGYELLNDLDFNTGQATRSDDAYYNGGAGWTPIGGTYASTFQGNGHSIANLAIDAGSDAANVGLFAVLGSGGVLSGVGLPDASVSGAADALSIGALAGDNVGTVRASWATGSVTSSSAGSGVKRVGGLVGISGGTVQGSYAGVSVTASNAATAVSAGGLAGQLYNNAITASYATGAVAGGAGAGSHTGGLVGWANGPTPSITASYSTGAVTSGASANVGGLVGTLVSGGTAPNSYWDTDASGITGTGAGTGQTTSALQTPTAYGNAGIYSAWNVNVDGVGGNDDPWNFGASNQYPVLQYDRDAVAIDRQRGSTGKDYDGNNNNLIDVTTLAQLDAMRYDGNGDGIVAKGSHSGHYAMAFPGLSAGMGCPDGCTGYELRNSLDFDSGTAGDRTDDAFYNGGAGWIPIRNYNSTLQGNGHTISNLHVNASPGVHHAGLFGPSSGQFSGIGLSGVSITGASNGLKAGALIGTLWAEGSVTSSWATGRVTSTNSDGNEKSVGGLVGINFAPIRASYADVAVTAATDATATKVNAGGLVGKLPHGSITASYATGAVTGGYGATSYAGGLAGQLESGTAPAITASYAIGTVAAGSGANVGGLAGNLPTGMMGATITYSYWDTDTSGIADTTPLTSAGEGKTTNELRTPTAYGTSTTTSIYAAWNVDIDNADTDDDFATGGDDPWDFGENDEYPVLKYGGLDTAMQVNLQPTVGTLTSLILTGATLSSAFDTATLAYTATLPDGSTAAAVTVAATSTNPTATVSYSAVAGTADAVIADADADRAGHQVILGGPNTVITITVTPQNGVAQSYTVTIAVPTNDYDDDDNNLIDVTTLAQLDAIRWDLDGDGVADNAAGAVAYAAAYLYPAAGMGCAGTCAGYELLADLDFNTGQAARTDDDYYNGGAGWMPIGGTYTGVLQGNGHTLSNLAISAGSTVGRVGLFAALTGAITGVGLPDASVVGAADGLSAGVLVGDSSGTVTSSWATGSVTASNAGSGLKHIGGLVGVTAGSIRASYAGVSVTASTITTATEVRAGGLLGQLANGTVTASYATGPTAGGYGANSYAGGLVGRLSGGGGPTITASYATGGATSGTGGNAGGLAGNLPSGATITASYWDTDASGITGTGAGTGQTTSALQTPTAYGTGIYSAWNVDVDGVGGNDDPWQFGGNNQYPILQFDRDVIAIDRQRGSTGKDYDANDNNLIDITTLAQLDAMRYDGDGDGVVAKGNASAKYAAAFPGLSIGMGCPDTCIGYELRANLDFDTGTPGDRTDDAYYNGGAGWGPFRYNATFQGNGNVISNLHINASAGIHNVGLFSGGTARVSGLGLPNVSITGASNGLKAGAIIGTLYAQSEGSVTASWATGSVTSTNSDGNEKSVGGLVGVNFAPIRASYADVTVTASTANTATMVNAGGLVGKLPYGSITASYATGTVTGGYGAASYAGGLAGQLESGTSPTITASYATGMVTAGAGANIGGLAGNAPADATITASYWDTSSSGITGTGAGAGKTTSELQTPTAYGVSTTTSIYANWNLNLDGVAGDDDPWDFGYDSQYPVLQYGGLDILKQGRNTILFNTDAVAVDEADASGAIYTVRLGGRPTAAVTVAIASDNTAVTIDDGDGTFGSDETLNFSTTNWFTAQTITVKAADDANLIDDTATLTHTATGAGSGFAGVSAALPVAISDDDKGSIVLAQNGVGITALGVTEEGSSVTYDVTLNTAPLANVTVTITVPSTPIDYTDAVEINKAGGTFGSSQTLTFTPMDYNTAQTVTVRAPDDSDGIGESFNLSHAATDATATASGFDGASKDLAVTVTDNNTANILLSVSALTIAEDDDSGGSYTVQLATQPTASVTVTATAPAGLTIDDDTGTDFGARNADF